MSSTGPQTALEAFHALDVRTGTIVAAEALPNARKPAYKIAIDFGELGLKQSSAQITERYRTESLIGKQILAVMNLPPKRIAGFVSDVLVLGVPDRSGAVVLLRADEPVANGAKVF